MTVLLAYHWFMVHSLWHAPVYGWLIFVSAWAPRAPFVWGLLPPFAIVFLEKIAFNTTHFWALLQHQLGGNGMDALTIPGGFPTNPLTQLTPGTSLLSVGLWMGLLVTAGFLMAAVRIRRSRGPI
ncbi:MAG TPA: hypothetical protein VM716_12115 [Gemmatimonadales bacterium]|nr:hypothetical protein [Gemmatimonadales bacterium]